MRVNLQLHFRTWIYTIWSICKCSFLWLLLPNLFSYCFPIPLVAVSQGNYTLESCQLRTGLLAVIFSCLSVPMFMNGCLHFVDKLPVHDTSWVSVPIFVSPFPKFSATLYRSGETYCSRCSFELLWYGSWS
jgi:hypothetical protein